MTSNDGACLDSVRDEFTRGYVQVYTGDGKGKTTAALGLALRAAGAGFSVYFGQFIKGARYSEAAALERLAANGQRIVCKQYGRGCIFNRAPEPEEIEMARAGLAEAREAASSGEFQLAVLDEANVAAAIGLLAPSELMSVIDARHEMTELVFTGRGAPLELIERADLVTEMREIKHYYRSGVIARRGIES